MSAQIRKIVQPSISCKTPWAIAIPHLSTVTPISAIRKLFMPMVSGTELTKITNRFQVAAR